MHSKVLSIATSQPSGQVAYTTMATSRLSMKARTGTDNQRYGPNGERLVAGVVPLNKDKSKVLLIQSSSRKGWVLPKGGWELDEATAAAAAQREAWEEAGILCSSIKEIGQIADPRTPTSSKNVAKAFYYFFEVIVGEERADWPERAKRCRQWFSYAEAVALLTARPELLEALVKSSITK